MLLLFDEMYDIICLVSLHRLASVFQRTLSKLSHAGYLDVTDGETSGDIALGTSAA